VARCDASTVSLVSWSPNPGYRADDVVRGPAVKATMKFESDTANDLFLTVTCVNGVPQLTERVEIDDHGGTGDDHGGATEPGDDKGTGSGHD
jgi:hypothetical protein